MRVPDGQISCHANQSRLAEIRRVASHPMALAQCRRFFADHPGVEPVAAYERRNLTAKLARALDSM